MYQVISIIDGEYRHEGFFPDERQANEHKDYLECRMYCGLSEEDFEVRVIEL
jgi:hypothetical protein